ncbi:hypothetical protein WHR41_04001 [Cladosporium halotolerans]|uniref:DUF2293 domain-containing protein n=1 Tax=Cladosporium halotolerans TaxID=1052096 RepID=A0AB34KUQ4_9PEZI
MVTSTGASRASSVLSNARTTLKRREKPYKTEQQKMIGKKRKLDVNTTYSTQAPKGFIFLEVGTPDLAELCKEVSRKRSLPVHIVHAQPVNHNALNPAKISHHIHRIGYHFRSEVMREACAALQYVPFHRGFIKAADFEKEEQNSKTAQILAKHGVKYNLAEDNKETPEQVRGAIKELFPKIPEKDLDEIVTRAWEKGTDRIGSAQGVPLARRVQLATIARIRHVYTDYDSLLNAFGDWKNTRKEVEPICLKKLMEWRGENSVDDEGLEEIVRETIVIDDDDDDDDDDEAVAPTARRGGDPSDSDDVSDTSIEISHRPAAGDDLRAEEGAERDHRYFQRYHRPHRLTLAERGDIARQKISDARSLMHIPAAVATHDRRLPAPNLQPLYRGRPPYQEWTDGRALQRVPARPPQHYTYSTGSYVAQDRPIQSIERDDTVQLPPAHRSRAPTEYHSRPATPERARLGVQPQHFVDLTQDSPQEPPAFNGGRRFRDQGTGVVPREYKDADMIDLTSPRRAHTGQPMAQPQAIRVVSSGDVAYREVQPADPHAYPIPVERFRQSWHGEDHSPRYRQTEAPEYDPRQPLLDEARSHRPQAASPAQPGRCQPVHYPAYYPDQQQQPEVRYVRRVAEQDYYAPPLSAPAAQFRPAPPLPVHGAPAPVQQMPRELAYPARSVEYIPVNGAPAYPRYAVPPGEQYPQR